MASLPTPTRSSSSSVGLFRALEAAVVAILVIGTWEAVCRLAELPRFLVPAPSQIGVFALKHWRELLLALTRTAAEAAATLLASTVIGVALALFFSLSRTAERLAFPYIVVLQAVPIVATAPLFIIWFGPDFRSIVAIAVLMTVFPILSNMLTGLKSTPHQLLELFQVNRVSRWQTFLRLRLPAAIPYLGTGLKIASPLAVIGVIVGEYVAGLGSSGAGLGFLITQSALRLETAGVFAAGLTAAFVGILFWQGIGVAIAAQLGDWHETEAKSR